MYLRDISGMFPRISGTSQGCSRVSRGHLGDVPVYLGDVPVYLGDVPAYLRDISGISEAYHLVIFHIGSKYLIIV